MTTRRTARVAEAIRQTVSMAILTELRDPRIQGVTVTRVEAASDMRTAKVYVSILGDEKLQKLCLHGLNSAKGVLQAKIADRMKSRFTPVLRFIIDDGVKKSIEASRLIREALATSPPGLIPEDVDEQDGSLLDAGADGSNAGESNADAGPDQDAGPVHGELEFGDEADRTDL